MEITPYLCIMDIEYTIGRYLLNLGVIKFGNIHSCLQSSHYPTKVIKISPSKEYYLCPRLRSHQLDKVLYFKEFLKKIYD